LQISKSYLSSEKLAECEQELALLTTSSSTALILQMPTKPLGLKHKDAREKTCSHDLPHDAVEVALDCAHEDAEATEAAQHKATALHAWTAAGYETRNNAQVLAQRETGRDVEAAAGAFTSAAAGAFISASASTLPLRDSCAIRYQLSRACTCSRLHMCVHVFTSGTPMKHMSTWHM